MFEEKSMAKNFHTLWDLIGKCLEAGKGDQFQYRWSILADLGKLKDAVISLTEFWLKVTQQFSTHGENVTEGAVCHFKMSNSGRFFFQYSPNSLIK